jgi:hypothetical protein
MTTIQPEKPRKNLGMTQDPVTRAALAERADAHLESVGVLLSEAMVLVNDAGMEATAEGIHRVAGQLAVARSRLQIERDMAGRAA